MIPYFHSQNNLLQQVYLYNLVLEDIRLLGFINFDCFPSFKKNQPQIDI